MLGTDDDDEVEMQPEVSTGHGEARGSGEARAQSDAEVPPPPEAPEGTADRQQDRAGRRGGSHREAEKVMGISVLARLWWVNGTQRYEARGSHAH